MTLAQSNSLDPNPPSRCPLCHEPEIPVWQVCADGRSYHRCPVCDLRFLSPKLRLSREEEQIRYRLHQAHNEDLGYRKFVGSLLNGVQKILNPRSRLLDFGAGHQPVLAHWLRQLDYQVQIYDPFFWPDEPSGDFDAIVACEVLEHMFEPGRTLASLFNSRLRPSGFFFAMTHLYEDHMDFADWYYRRDPTHVCFYSRRSLLWLAESTGFDRHVEVVGGRLAIMKKKVMR